MVTTTFTVAREPLHQISPDLWGIFLEDINDALDGGLNAELLRNGGFAFTGADADQWGPLTGWRVRSPRVTRTVLPREIAPLHPNNPVHVRIEGPTLLRNEGFDGVHVSAGSRYRLRFAARLSPVDGPTDDSRTELLPGRLSASLATVTGDPLTASADIPVTESDWTWHEVDLVATGIGHGALELQVPDGHVVDLDAVSLRPLGPDGQPILFRQDLVDTLADLRPSFVRFPGGCLAHGVGLENIYDWKGSIGPLESRRPLPNPWGYHQSRTIGYFEFFLLCEQLGAAPLPVVAAGVCCQNTPGGPRAVPWDEMPAYIQDVLDLVEFAGGDISTTWGSRRAEFGHPEPFDLRYLGVGNEDEITEEFRTRYAAIEKAVRDAHPGLTVIGTSGPGWTGRDFERGWETARGLGTALVDEHYYDSPLWFQQNLDRYDSYDRSGPGVYLGEYAARSNTVRSALAEAAGMIGLERNGDVVRLASYAPLLARVGHTQWTPDLFFDSERVLPSASYHVQRLFSTERGTAAHRVTADGGATTSPVEPLARGTIRLRPASAPFAVTDVQVSGISARDAHLEPGTSTDLVDATLTDLDLTFTATRERGEQGLTIELGDGSGDHVAYAIGLGGWKDELSGVNRIRHGIGGDCSDAKFWAGFATGVPAHVRVRISEGRIRVWVDDEQVHDLTPSREPEEALVAGAASRPVQADGVGRAADAADGADIEHVIRLVNATPEVRSARVALEGRRVTGARAQILAGAEPQEGVPFEASPVEPVGIELEATGGVLAVDLAPWSLTSAVVASTAS
jgi:hypothetical protein